MVVVVAGKQVRGDLIVKAVLRSDLAPIPLTFEGEFRVDGDFSASVEEGKPIEVAGNGMVVIKHERVTIKQQQGGRLIDAVKITAVLAGIEQLSFIRDTPVIKENKSFLECLKACGVTLPLEGDFPVPRFSVFKGFIPSYQVSMVLQEESRALNWCFRTKKLIATRLLDFPSKPPFNGGMITGNKVDQSEFLERHTVPTFYSIKDDATLVMGDKSVARNTMFVPKKTADQLFNMTRALILTHSGKIPYSGTMQAGDVVQLTTGDKRVVLTIAHVFKSGTDGHDAQDQYSRVWLGEVKP